MSENYPSPKSAPGPEAVRAYYDQFSSDRLQDYARQKNPRIEKAVARILPLVSEDSTVLEIGCGAGFVAERIGQVACRGSVWACDLSEQAIALARQRITLANAHFRVVDVAAGLAEVKTWLPKPVDLAVLVDVIEHISPDAQTTFFHELADVLHAGSAVVLTFPSPDYQRHLREHHPEQLQIIDEIIELPRLHDLATLNGFAIKHFSLEDVWLPNQYVHCILTRRMPVYAARDHVAVAMEALGNLIPPGRKFILVDQEEWRQRVPPGRDAIPFLEREGRYWGPPPDDETAIRECERLRAAGAGFMVFAAPAFWWLEYYQGLHQYLRSRFRCVLRHESLVVFDLHPVGPASANNP